MLLSQHEHVIQALPPDGAHQPFRERVLPRALRCGEDFADPQVSEAILETFAVDLVPVSDQVLWRPVFREGFQDLLSGPTRRRMFGHVEMNHPAPMMGQNHQNEQHSESCSFDGKEIDGNQVLQIVIEERLPGLRRRSTLSGQESRHSSFRDVDTQLEQLPVDAGCSPKRVGRGHLQDQGSNHGADFWTSALPPGHPGPEPAKVLAMPSHNGLWFYDNQHPAPFSPPFQGSSRATAVRVTMTSGTTSPPITSINCR
jgi:hypothetical protein